MFSAAGRKEAFPTRAAPSSVPGPTGDRAGAPGGPRPAARPRRTARPSPPTLRSGGSGCLSLHPALPSHRGVGLIRCLKDDSGRTRRSLNLFIYRVPLRPPSPPPRPTPRVPSLTDVDDGVRPHGNALKYPGEKPEHQHFHFQPLAQHISPGSAERQAGGKKKKGARAGGAGGAGGRDALTPPVEKIIPNSHGTQTILRERRKRTMRRGEERRGRNGAAVDPGLAGGATEPPALGVCRGAGRPRTAERPPPPPPPPPPAPRAT